MPVSEWNADDLSRNVIASCENGLNAAATVLVASVKDKLGAHGATPTMLSLGRKILRALARGKYGRAYFPQDLGKESKRAYDAAFEETQIGRVDPPGGYPRLRTGNLRRAADFQRAGRDAAAVDEHVLHLRPLAQARDDFGAASGTSMADNPNPINRSGEQRAGARECVTPACPS